MEELSLHIIDLVENSKRAGAKNIRVEIRMWSEKDLLCLKVSDDGCGIKPEEILKVQDPFYSTKKNKKVGLGIPLLKQNAEMCDGKFEINSSPGKGTEVLACFKLSHIDRPPIGNLDDTILTLIVGSPEFNIEFIVSFDNSEFSLSTEELKKILGPVPLSNPDVIKFLKNYIDEGTGFLKAKKII